MVMKTRARLAELSTTWKIKKRKKVESLKTAIEATMNNAFTTMTIVPGFKDSAEFNWSLRCESEFKLENENVSEFGHRGANSAELEHQKVDSGEHESLLGRSKSWFRQKKIADDEVRKKPVPSIFFSCPHVFISGQLSIRCMSY